MHKLFTGPTAAKELAALLAIVDFRRPNLSRDPSPEYLAFVAGLEVQDFKAALASLEEKGYITTQEVPDGISVNLDGLLCRLSQEAKV